MRIGCARPAALVAALCLFGAAGCAAHNEAAMLPPRPRYDRPVPASEPRASAGYQVDLEPVADCEQRFDLQLYANLNVELIRWDDGDGCHHRAIDVKYLSGRLDEPQLFILIRKLARSASRRPPVPRDTPGKPSGDTPSAEK